MIQIKNYLSGNLASEVEVFIAESEASPWCLIKEYDIRCQSASNDPYLTGYFETPELALENWSILRSTFAGLPKRPRCYSIEDTDWKNVYKQHYKPWSYGGLHWVPDWEKDTHKVTDNEEAIYLDPGMAFGMSDHPSTRLCLLSLVQCRDQWCNDFLCNLNHNLEDSGSRYFPSQSWVTQNTLCVLKSKTVIDAGCGSGILALSAAKLGFGEIYAFDNDHVAVTISRKNAEKNGLAAEVSFELADLKLALTDRSADLIFANILSGSLCENAAILLNSVKPHGYLILSGMLENELEGVKAQYQITAKKVEKTIVMKVNTLNDWSSLCIHRI